MARTILITGFGPFPGAPVNPTQRLIGQLARLRPPAGVKIVPHVFRTGYADVDRELPALIAKHKPAALLMFGLAARTRAFRIETRARNAVSGLPDATGRIWDRRKIADGVQALALSSPAQALLIAARNVNVPVIISRDAGDYLCNYLCWRAVHISRKAGGPALAAFVHVPDVHRGGSLLRAGRALLAAIAKV
ncbi:MAG TPA: pyroglutamyl-peptidase I [Pseudolabrys sp.]|jgi:pyroglutamyl-peptidase|nr:pyroglutamyl-peptidase I [Pseudolabrys sp.]